MSEPSIKTTVVGSYPLPAWLAAYPSVPNLRDAILVVLKTQELAGLDVISDGELTRFDVNHPETNGMIEYFVRPMAGISSQMGRKDVADFRAQQGMGFRTQPAGVVEGPIDEGELDLPSSWQLMKELTSTPLKFTVTAPYMLAKTLLDRHYGDLPSLTMAIADVLRRQVEAIDAPVLQVDEANLTGNPEDAAWAYTSRSTMCWTARAGNARCISASATTAARASRAASGPICSASSTNCTWTTWCWSSPAAAMMNWRSSPTCARVSLWGSGLSTSRTTKWKARMKSPGAFSTRSTCWARSGSSGSTPTAASGCCRARSLTARCRRWWQDGISFWGERRGKRHQPIT